jgi:hypothetical protein
MLSLVHRSSNWALTPAAQPRFRSSFRKARTRACISTFVGGYGIRIPIRRTRSACCERAASGHAAVAPPSSVMNSRRFIRSPRRRGRERIQEWKANRFRGFDVDDEFELGGLTATSDEQGPPPTFH